MTPQILVYRDKGVSPTSYKHILKRLSSYSVLTVDHDYLMRAPGWEEKATLFVMPGGRDAAYHTLLQGIGNKRLAAFVARGGSYLGICAGGYYGSAYVEFEKGQELEVCGARELAFYPGRAIGPAYGPGLFDYKTERGACTAQIKWCGGISPVYFNGGCLFHAPETHPSVQVLARYYDLPKQPAAIVKCALGEGNALLSGVHPEYPESTPLWDYLLYQILILI